MRILGEEHDDCDNWARWCRRVQLGLGFPAHWPVPDGPDWHLEEDKDIRLEDDLRARYDDVRALETDGYFRIWLDAYRLHGRRWGRRHFMILRSAYLLHRDMGELTVRESLRALADLKDRERRRKACNSGYSVLRYGGQGVLRPEKANA